MPDTTSPISKGDLLAALKTVRLAERQVLELDIHSARARAETLLDGAVSATFSVSDPIALLSKENTVNRPAAGPRVYTDTQY